MIVADKKRDLILEKAVARFAHFGVHKTTMNEIADDLAMSKPSLYYYFPDKISLVVAVLERIFVEYHRRLADRLDKATGIEDAISSMLELRNEYVQKYFRLSLGTTPGDINLSNEEIRSSIMKSRELEIQILKDVFERAAKKQGLKVADASHTTELFMDMLAGISICIMARQEKQLVPNILGFNEVLSRQKELTHIFLNGLR